MLSLPSILGGLVHICLHGSVFLKHIHAVLRLSGGGSLGSLRSRLGGWLRCLFLVFLLVIRWLGGGRLRVAPVKAAKNGVGPRVFHHLIYVPLASN
jgi:hypothetical protein